MADIIFVISVNILDSENIVIKLNGTDIGFPVDTGEVSQMVFSIIHGFLVP